MVSLLEQREVGAQFPLLLFKRWVYSLASSAEGLAYFKESYPRRITALDTCIPRICSSKELGESIELPGLTLKGLFH